MVRLFFLLGGVSVLAAGPLSHNPEPITSSHVKSEAPCPVNAPNCPEPLAAMLRR